jgi:hypothetical protein
VAALVATWGLDPTDPASAVEKVSLTHRRAARASSLQRAPSVKTMLPGVGGALRMHAPVPSRDPGGALTSQPLRGRAHTRWPQGEPQGGAAPVQEFPPLPETSQWYLPASRAGVTQQTDGRCYVGPRPYRASEAKNQKPSLAASQSQDSTVMMMAVGKGIARLSR